MNTHASAGRWQMIAVLAACLIFGGFFAMGAIFKFADMSATAGYIASVGLPAPPLLAWLAAFFTEASLLAAAYVLFLAVVFHGPARWEGDRTVLRFFLLHLTFIAGLLFVALHEPGTSTGS